MTEKRFVLSEKPMENKPFLYRVMTDILTSKSYDNSLKGLDDIINLCNNHWEQIKRLTAENERLKQKLEVCEKRIGDEWGGNIK